MINSAYMTFDFFFNPRLPHCTEDSCLMSDPRKVFRILRLPLIGYMMPHGGPCPVIGGI